MLLGTRFKRELKNLIGGFGELKSSENKRCGLHFMRTLRTLLMPALQEISTWSLRTMISTSNWSQDSNLNWLKSFLESTTNDLRDSSAFLKCNIMQIRNFKQIFLQIFTAEPSIRMKKLSFERTKTLKKCVSSIKEVLMSSILQSRKIRRNYSKFYWLNFQKILKSFISEISK